MLQSTCYSKFSCVKKNTCTVIVDIVHSTETECPEMSVASAVSHAAQRKFYFQILTLAYGMSQQLQNKVQNLQSVQIRWSPIQFSFIKLLA
jgi:hypothetical protein